MVTKVYLHFHRGDPNHLNTSDLQITGEGGISWVAFLSGRFALRLIEDPTSSDYLFHSKSFHPDGVLTFFRGNYVARKRLFLFLFSSDSLGFGF